MELETDGQEAGAGAETIVEAPTVETPSEATTEQDAGTETLESPDAGAEPKPKQVPWFQKRIDEVTRQKHEAAREAAYWRGKAEAANHSQSQPEQPSGPPSLDQFDYDEAAHQRATVEYYTKQAEKVAERVIESRTQADKQQAQLETAQTRLQAGASKHPDFAEIVSDIPVTDAVTELLVSDDRAADILYELGKDADALSQFTRLSPVRQAVELGKIAARLEAPKAASSRNIPPPPPQTVAGLSAGMSKMPEEMSMAEYVVWQRERDKA